LKSLATDACPSGTAISFFPCPVGTIEGSQVISIPGGIGVVVNHFRDNP